MLAPAAFMVSLDYPPRNVDAAFQEAVSFTATMPQSESANAIGTITGDSFFSWQNTLVMTDD